MGSLKCWLTACAIVCVAAAAVNATPAFRDAAPQVSVSVIDDMIIRYKESLIETGNVDGEVSLDDIKINISLPLTVAKIWATGGILSNVLTVKRISPVEVDFLKYQSAVTLKASIKFAHLEITFDTLKIKYPLLNEKAGSLHVDLSDGAIETEIVIWEHDPCQAYLKEIKFLYFKKFKPHVKGLKWGVIPELIIKGVGKYLQKFSKATIERYFYHQLQEAVEDINVCDLDLIYLAH